jgi:hypothetical protein
MISVAHHHDRGRAVVERAAVARGYRPIRAEHGLEPADGVEGDTGARTVVAVHGGAVRQFDRGDLARVEAVLDRLLGQVLRPDRELVLLGSADTAYQSHVLRGLPHGDVGVGQHAVFPRVVPALGAALGRGGGARAGVGEQRVRGVRKRVAAALDVPAHRLHASRDEHVALAGLDRVHGHPRGLQGRRAVAGERGARQVVVTEQHRDHPGHVEPGLATGQAAAQHQVVHVRRVELRHLVQRRAHDGSGQVVRPQILQGPLEGASDRRPGRSDDYRVSHELLHSYGNTSPSLLRRGRTVESWRDNPWANPRWLRTTRSPFSSGCPRD